MMSYDGLCLIIIFLGGKDLYLGIKMGMAWFDLDFLTKFAQYAVHASSEFVAKGRAW